MQLKDNEYWANGACGKSQFMQSPGVYGLRGSLPAIKNNSQMAIKKNNMYTSIEPKKIVNELNHNLE